MKKTKDQLVIAKLLRAIHSNCLDCIGEDISDNGKEVVLCPSEKCPVWQYRLGKLNSKKK